MSLYEVQYCYLRQIFSTFINLGFHFWDIFTLMILLFNFYQDHSQKGPEVFSSNYPFKNCVEYVIDLVNFLFNLGIYLYRTDVFGCCRTVFVACNDAIKI